MTIPEPILIKLITPQRGPMTTRLPGKSARTNAALIAGVKARDGK